MAPLEPTPEPAIWIASEIVIFPDKAKEAPLETVTPPAEVPSPELLLTAKVPALMDVAPL